jgi:hypothetical protein
LRLRFWAKRATTDVRSDDHWAFAFS